MRYKDVTFASLLIVIGVVCLGLFLAGQITAPNPSADQSAGDSKGLASISFTPALSFSRPVELQIPSITVRSSVIPVGKNRDGSIGTPSASNFDKVAWYEHSPAPGQAGVAVMEGHVDYLHKGPGVFFKLGDLKKGDTIAVRREDGHTATFVIYKVKMYPKSQFPTDEVYGASVQPSLALITCGGQLNHRTHAYEGNIVAFGVLVA
jgi:sortase (surface protein transpeptidase)